MTDEKTVTSEKKDWLKEQVAYLEKLKARSKAQDLLIELYKKPNRTSKDEYQLGILKRAEKAAFDAAAARAKAVTLLHQQKKKDRSARTHRLIQYGLLIEWAGLEQWDRQELLGALLSMKDSEPTLSAEKRAKWQQKGHETYQKKHKDANAKENDAEQLANALLPKKKPTKKTTAPSSSS